MPFELVCDVILTRDAPTVDSAPGMFRQYACGGMRTVCSRIALARLSLCSSLFRRTPSAASGPAA